MRRKDAVDLFGTPGELAQALGVTPQAIYQWPEKLPLAFSDRVVGAAIRIGKFPTSSKMPGLKRYQRAAA